jgi:hypothetical protein
VTKGLPASFVVPSNGNTGTCKAGSTVLATDPAGTNEMVCVKDYGSGQVVNWGSAGNYGISTPFSDANVARMLVQSVDWLCQTGLNALHPGDTTRVVTNSGYRARCDAWSGMTCTEPYIAMNTAHVTAPDPHCIDDTTSLRPMWWSDLDMQATTWCWIASGDSNPLAAGMSAATVTASGWMYTDAGSLPICDDGGGRHYSTVAIPVVGEQTWSFDDTSWTRDGSFSTYQCNWSRVAQFSTSWMRQVGTNQQFTRCGSVTNGGATCVDPEIRYGSTLGGVPEQHSGNDFTLWCQQLGFSGAAATPATYGTRACAAPGGRLFGCSMYDETTWHWCDASDGYWLNSTLDNHTCSSFTNNVTSVTCVP